MCMHRCIYRKKVVPRQDWRTAQERIDDGIDQWVYQNVCPSATMWDELDGNTAAEKKKGLDHRTYLSIRKDPARASTKLTKPLTFDDLVVFVHMHSFWYHAFYDIIVQEWNESYYFFDEIPPELAGYMQSIPFQRMCNCTNFWHYARCVHALMYSVAKNGRGIVPRGEDTRIVGPRAEPGKMMMIMI